MKNRLTYKLFVFFVISTIQVEAQVKVIIENGQIFVNDPLIRPSEKKLKPFIDSLDRNLKAHPKDTTNLFYRALLYLHFNEFVFNPDLSINPTNKLLLAQKMADKADSLKMQSFNLKVLRAQISKELTNRYAPIDSWRFNAKQIIDRKRKYEYYKDLANKYYDELAVLDKKNALDYQKLKVK